MPKDQPSIPNAYTIGDTVFLVTPVGGGVQEIKAMVGMGNTDATGRLFLDNGAPSQRAGVELLKKLIERYFRAEILERSDDPLHEIIFRVQPPTKHTMRIERTPIAATPATANQIVELKPLPAKLKNTLSDDEFDTFMLDVSKRYPTEDKARHVLDRIQAFETRRKEMTAISRRDRGDARIEAERFRKAIKQVGHLLRPLISTLTKHGIAIDSELSEELVYSLLQGWAATTDADRASKQDGAIGKATENYIKAIERKMIELSVEVDDPKGLKEDLSINIGKAEKQHRGRRAA
jgi:hypothetical protein